MEGTSYQETNQRQERQLTQDPELGPWVDGGSGLWTDLGNIPGVPQLSWLTGWAETTSPCMIWPFSLSATQLHAEYRSPGNPDGRCLVSGISMGQREGRLSVWRWKRGDEKPCFRHLQWVVSVQKLMRPREEAARSVYPACLPHLIVQQYQQLPALSLLTSYYVCVRTFTCLF